MQIISSKVFCKFLSDHLSVKTLKSVELTQHKLLLALMARHLLLLEWMLEHGSMTLVGSKLFGYLFQTYVKP